MEDLLCARTVTESRYYAINPKTLPGPLTVPSNAY